MAGYFFIQSLDSITETRTAAQFKLMRELAERKNAVRVLLVQNAVFMAPGNVHCPELDALVKAGVEVSVDDFSLAQRGMADTGLRAGLRTAPISSVIDAMLQQQKVIWN